MPSFDEMLQRMLTAHGQGRAAKTVEVFGWLILVESLVLFLAPETAAALLRLPALSEQAANYLRLVGLLVGGLGMLYIVSGRLNAQGFVFAPPRAVRSEVLQPVATVKEDPGHNSETERESSSAPTPAQGNASPEQEERKPFRAFLRRAV